jgi:hypothetical protein
MRNLDDRLPARRDQGNYSERAALLQARFKNISSILENTDRKLS